MPPRPDQRPNVSTSLGDHEKRIRALERVARIAGWIFNFDNEGGWAEVVANDPIPDTDTSFRLKALEDGDGNGGDFEITAENILFLEGQSEAELSGPDVVVTASSSVLVTSDGSVELSAGSAQGQIALSGTGDISIKLNTGGRQLIVYDHLNSPLVTFTG